MEMDDALPRKRQKKELYTYLYLYLYLSVLSVLFLANQLNTNISCHHHHPGMRE